MASRHQIEANRANAKRSTGPKTEVGKARSSRNAFRHGLSRWEPEESSADVLVAVIGPALMQPFGDVAALDLAHAGLQLAGVRDVRLRLLAALLADPDSVRTQDLAGLERYERAARARQRRGLRRLQTR